MSNKKKQTRQQSKIWYLVGSLFAVALIGLIIWALIIFQSSNKQLCADAQQKLDEYHRLREELEAKGLATGRPLEPIVSEEEQTLCNLPAF
jgi:flagellar biosynthesis/type III secretory pathway M-ring protein FliF/YscJ